MRRQRRLTSDEARLWAQVAHTVRPLHPIPPRSGKGNHEAPPTELAVPAKARKPTAALNQPAAAPPPRSAENPKRPLDRHGLDGGWEKRLARGALSPDFTLDLHGHSLDAAHARLDHGLSQALALGARVVLVITGRPRPAEAADRGGTRGAIRAKLLDWLAHGSHAHKIAAVRGAHRRHGGAGALYLIMKRPR